MADDLIYPATNSGLGDMSGYDVNGKKHRESMIARLLQQFREGNFVVEGLEVTAGTGLDVNIAIGECNIDGRRIVINTARTHILADNTTNYVYLQLSFDALSNVNGVNVVSNTTGTAPNSSVYLSNVTTSTGAIDTIVDTREEHYVLNADNADKLDGKHYADIQSWVNVSADVPNADHADNADKLDGKHYADIQSWVNVSADVPNADHADNATNADNASKVLNITPRWRENVLPNIQYSFASLSTGPQGLTWDGTNLWHVDYFSNQIYKLSAAGTVLDSFQSPCITPRGLTWDGTNLWIVDDDTPTLIYKLNTAGAVSDSWFSPSTSPQGLAWDGTNLWHSDSDADTIYKLNTSGTVLDSFASPGNNPQGLAWDGTNLWNADSTTDTIYKLNTSGTVLDSWASPSTFPTGLAWDGTNLWHSDSTAETIYKLSVNKYTLVAD